MSRENLIHGPIHRYGPMVCLHCQKTVDSGVGASGDRAPQPNDVAVCGYCGHLQAYGDEGKFRELNDAEILECAGDPEILMAQEFARDFRAVKATR